MRNKFGFTLFELIVVLAILAIIASLGVPSFFNWRGDAKLRDAVSLLRGDLEMAKLSAIKENDFVAVMFNANGYAVFVDDGAGGGIDGNWIRDGSEEVLRTRQLPAGVRINLAGTTFDSNRTRFNGRGHIVNQGVVTVVNSKGRQKKISINNRFGRITVN